MEFVFVFLTRPDVYHKDDYRDNLTLIYQLTKHVNQEKKRKKKRIDLVINK